MWAKRQMKIYLMSIIIFAILCPLGLEFFIFRNSVYSVLTNGEWGAFLGSFLGGIVSGIGTLFAVYITTSETREIQKKTEDQIDKRFTDDIATIVAEYITDISDYFYANKTVKYLNEILELKRKELDTVESNILSEYNNYKANVSDMDNLIKSNMVIEELKERQSMLINKIQQLQEDINKTRRERKIANKCYFLLKIKLRNIGVAEKLLKQLVHIHMISNDIIDIEKETKEMMDYTTIFIERYKSESKGIL